MIREKSRNMGIESPMLRAGQGAKRILALKNGEIEGGVRMRMKEVKQIFIKKYIYKEKIARSLFLQKLVFPKRLRELVSHFL